MSLRPCPPAPMRATLSFVLAVVDAAAPALDVLAGARLASASASASASGLDLSVGGSAARMNGVAAMKEAPAAVAPRRKWRRVVGCESIGLISGVEVCVERDTERDRT